MEIYTRYNQPTDTKGSTITAICVDICTGDKKQITRSYNYALSSQQNHEAVANELQFQLWDDSEFKDDYILVCGESTKSNRGYKMISKETGVRSWF
jgi:hypothetical protein